jgi:hypothetical protein
MYVNPFWLGVGATIGTEALLLLLAAIYAAYKR